METIPLFIALYQITQSKPDLRIFHVDKFTVEWIRHTMLYYWDCKKIHMGTHRIQRTQAAIVSTNDK